MILKITLNMSKYIIFIQPFIFAFNMFLVISAEQFPNSNDSNNNILLHVPNEFCPGIGGPCPFRQKCCYGGTICCPEHHPGSFYHYKDKFVWNRWFFLFILLLMLIICSGVCTYWKTCHRRYNVTNFSVWTANQRMVSTRTILEPRITWRMQNHRICGGRSLLWNFPRSNNRSGNSESDSNYVSGPCYAVPTYDDYANGNADVYYNNDLDNNDDNNVRDFNNNNSNNYRDPSSHVTSYNNYNNNVTDINGGSVGNRGNRNNDDDVEGDDNDEDNRNVSHNVVIIGDDDDDDDDDVIIVNGGGGRIVEATLPPSYSEININKPVDQMPPSYETAVGKNPTTSTAKSNAQSSLGSNEVEGGVSDESSANERPPSYDDES